MTRTSYMVTNETDIAKALAEACRDYNPDGETPIQAEFVLHAIKNGSPLAPQAGRTLKRCLKVVWH